MTQARPEWGIDPDFVGALRTGLVHGAPGRPPSPPVPLPPPRHVPSEPAPLFEQHLGRRGTLRITSAELSLGDERLPLDAIDEISYFREPALGLWPTLVLLLLLPIGLLVLALHRGRYRCRLRGRSATIGVVVRTGRPGSARHREAEERWTALVGALHQYVSPVVVDRLADRMFAGEVVRIGRMRFDGEGVAGRRRVRWTEVGSPGFDGHVFHVIGFDDHGRQREAGRIAAGRRNAVVAPMLIELARTRACRVTDTPPVSAHLRRASGTMAFGPVVYVGERGSRATRVTALVLSLALAATAVVGRIEAARSTGKRPPKPAWATAWDPRVSDLVAFVEHTRGLRFRHPVRVEFMPDDAFAQWIAIHQATAAPRQNALGRAVTGAPVSSLVVGVYFPGDRTVRVRGSELTPDVRVTLAHELTHALQDETFDLDRLRDRTHDDADVGLTAALEGDAVLVERAYYATLPAEERAQVTTAETGDGLLADENGDPSLAEAYVPYVFGPQLIAMLMAVRGDAARDDAFASPPNDALRLLDPALYVAGRGGPASVRAPKPPVGATTEAGSGTGRIGALQWFLTLSAQLDPRLVARTIEEWDGDAYTAYDDGGRRCITATVHVHPERTDDHLSDTFVRWASLAPSDRAVEVAGEEIRVRSCASGPPTSTVDASTAEHVLFTRNELVLNGIRAGWPVELAHCMADRALTELPVDTLTATPFVLPADWADRLDLYRAYCDR